MRRDTTYRFSELLSEFTYLTLYVDNLQNAWGAIYVNEKYKRSIFCYDKSLCKLKDDLIKWHWKECNTEYVDVLGNLQNNTTKKNTND
jgi:hypothetical protein